MKTSVLAFALWGLYFSLGLAGVFGEAVGFISPVFATNIGALLALSLVVGAFISAFLCFDGRRLQGLQVKSFCQRPLENGLIAIQIYSIAFFLPFVRDSLVGDSHLNRLYLEDKMAALGEYGLFNTIATAGAHLFVPSIVFAISRMSSTKRLGRSVGRAAVLFLCSLSYVFYVLAYVGRDGVVYWLMMAGVLIALFWPYFHRQDRTRVIGLSGGLLLLAIIPFVHITIARFWSADQGGWSSLFEYFGAQIVNFNDYSSMDRPITYGAISFPFFYDRICPMVAESCEPWGDIRELVFADYLLQGKAPWLFGTFVSEFTADFGFAGGVGVLMVLAVFCAWVCSCSRARQCVSVSRFLLIVFLFHFPYWGVFYFRFATINSYMLTNLAFIAILEFSQLIHKCARSDRVNKKLEAWSAK